MLPADDADLQDARQISGCTLWHAIPADKWLAALTVCSETHGILCFVHNINIQHVFSY